MSNTFFLSSQKVVRTPKRVGTLFGKFEWRQAPFLVVNHRSDQGRWNRWATCAYWVWRVVYEGLCVLKKDPGPLLWAPWCWVMWQSWT